MTDPKDVPIAELEAALANEKATLRAFKATNDTADLDKWIKAAGKLSELSLRSLPAMLAEITALREAVEAACGLAVCCMAQGCYSHDEIADMARATKPTFDAALQQKATT